MCHGGEVAAQNQKALHLAGLSFEILRLGI
jgi:hypothetical protein